MAWFSRRPPEPGTFRVLSATGADGVGRMIRNGVPQRRMHVTGLVETPGGPPEAYSVDAYFGIDALPAVGSVVPCAIVRRQPLKVRIPWSTPALVQEVQAARADASAAVIQQLMTTGRATHDAGDTDPLGIALGDPTASATIAQQLAAAMGTPLSVDVDEGGVRKRITVGGGGHLSAAEAAQLQRTGTPATATITAAAKVAVPQALLPGPDASLWDLSLHVVREDGSSYDAATRTAFRSEARRRVLGAVGLTIPVRIDPTDDGRVAIDTPTFDRRHPDAPAG